jgi:hypothetical protein
VVELSKPADKSHPSSASARVPIINRILIEVPLVTIGDICMMTIWPAYLRQAFAALVRDLDLLLASGECVASGMLHAELHAGEWVYRRCNGSVIREEVYLDLGCRVGMVAWDEQTCLICMRVRVQQLQNDHRVGPLQNVIAAVAPLQLSAVSACFLHHKHHVKSHGHKPQRALRPTSHFTQSR